MVGAVVEEPRLSWRAQQLLRAPKALWALAGIAGLNSNALLNDARQVDSSSICAIIGMPAEGVAATPSEAHERRLQDRRALEPQYDRYGIEANGYYDIYESEILASRERLVQSVVAHISNWAWKPAAQNLRQTLLADPRPFSRIAHTISEAAGSDWWWQPIQRENQIRLGSPARPPEVEANRTPAELYAAYEILRPPRDLITSTGIGPEVPAVELYDVEVLSRLRRPIGCWRFPIFDDARVWEVQSSSDWFSLCERYPRIGRVPSDWRSWGIDAPYSITPDWGSMAREWDALHVSMAGVLTATDMPIIAGSHATLCPAVNSEMTFWFRSRFETPDLVAVLSGDEDFLPCLLVKPVGRRYSCYTGRALQAVPLDRLGSGLGDYVDACLT